MAHSAHPSVPGGSESAVTSVTAPGAPGIDEPPEPVHAPDRPSSHSPPTVRVISASEGAQRKAEANPAVASPDERRRAAERFEQARADHAVVRARLLAAARLEADAQAKADAALAAYEDARVEARRATVVLRQLQREVAGTKLAVRRALEWVARLEVLDDQQGADGPGSPDPGASASRTDPSGSPPAPDVLVASAADRSPATPLPPQSNGNLLHPVP